MVHLDVEVVIEVGFCEHHPSDFRVLWGFLDHEFEGGGGCKVERERLQSYVVVHMLDVSCEVLPFAIVHSPIKVNAENGSEQQRREKRNDAVGSHLPK